jgi:hypothetical protein
VGEAEREATRSTLERCASAAALSALGKPSEAHRCITVCTERSHSPRSPACSRSRRCSPLRTFAALADATSLLSATGSGDHVSSFHDVWLFVHPLSQPLHTAAAAARSSHVQVCVCCLPAPASPTDREGSW